MHTLVNFQKTKVLLLYNTRFYEIKEKYISLIKAVKKVDAGPIAIQDKFYLDGTELPGEIRTKKGLSFLKIIKKIFN